MSDNTGDAELSMNEKTDLIEALLKKADKFLSKVSGSPKKKSAKGRRLTEKEEDALLQKAGERDLDAKDVFQRLLVQPSVITGGTLRAYQLEGLNFIINLYHRGCSAILADEMGLGKTLQSISVLAYVRQFQEIKGPHLVVVPLTCAGNWMNEFKKFCPAIKPIKFHGNKQERNQMIKEILEPGDFDVIVTSYEMCLLAKGPLKKIPFEFIVVDEAHRLKNENSQLSQVLRTFHSKHRLLLTGTPLQNNLHELWALLNFLLPELFDSSEDFDAMFASAEQDHTQGNLLGQLAKILAPFMLRRLKADVETSLPPKKEMILHVGMTKLQKEVYRNILRREAPTLSSDAKHQKTRLLNIVMQLRKAANHPYLFDGVEDRRLPPYGDHIMNNSGKMKVLDKLLFRLKAEGSRVLIFSQMTRTLDILEDYCVYRGHQYCRIDGNTKTLDREEYIAKYNKEGSEKFIFLLSTRSGGLGINLATADIVIIYDSDWNPQCDLQAMDRAHRIGQKKPVKVYRFITADSVEQKILERAQLKLRLDAMVVQQGRIQKSKISSEDMMEMISFGADSIINQQDVDTVTEEDIDEILRRGEEATDALNSKLDEHTGGLTKFSLDGSTSSDIYSFGGVDYKNKKKDLDTLKTIQAINQVEGQLGKRVRRKVDYTSQPAIYPKKFKCLIRKPLRIPRMVDHQLFDIKRILEITKKEEQFYDRFQFDPNPPALSGLTEQEIKERDGLLAEGFSDWKRRDFWAFTKAMAKYGRKDLQKICQALPHRSNREVARYRDRFLSHGAQLVKTYKTIMGKVENGEKKLQRNSERSQLLESILEPYPTQKDILDKLEIKMTGMAKDKGYTPDNDKLLLALTREIGYLEWDAIRERIQDEPSCEFDYFLLTRDSGDIFRRVESLITALNRSKESVAKKMARLEKLKAEKRAREAVATNMITTEKTGRQPPAKKLKV